MKTIYKFPLLIVDSQRVFAPATKIIHVGLDPSGDPHVWLEVDTDIDSVTVLFLIVGTGQVLPKNAGNHVGSFVHECFVWHVYQGVI